MNLYQFTASTKILQTPDNINYVDVSTFEWMRFAGELYVAKRNHPYWHKDEIFMFLGQVEQEMIWNHVGDIKLVFLNIKKKEKWDFAIPFFQDSFQPLESTNSLDATVGNQKSQEG